MGLALLEALNCKFQDALQMNFSHWAPQILKFYQFFCLKIYHLLLSVDFITNISINYRALASYKIIKDYISLEILGVTLKIRFQLVQLTCLWADPYGEFFTILDNAKNTLKV